MVPGGSAASTPGTGGSADATEAAGSALDDDDLAGLVTSTTSATFNLLAMTSTCISA